jgi:phosphatidylglycerol:prolipoprotein diacylglycerol transferase
MLETSWFDPVAFYIGPVAIRWYGLAYVSGFIAAFFFAKRYYFPAHQISHQLLDPFMSSMIISVIVGGRLGHILFYNLYQAIEDPMVIFKIWQGGMSFHGALIGLTIGLFIFSSYHRLSFWVLSDFVCLVAPCGIFFGRLANFINGELVGRVTDAWWAVVFPMVDQLPRHPSQLYEALFEGVFLGLLMWRLFRKTYAPGFISGIFLCAYAVIRFCMEFFRMPECPYGCYFGLDMGQMLSIVMFMTGLMILLRKTQYQQH